MISSQLGRVILGGRTASADEMTVSPDRWADHDPIDDVIDEVSARLEKSRRPEGRTSRDARRPVSRPSR